jgi:hypothetical protein
MLWYIEIKFHKRISYRILNLTSIIGTTQSSVETLMAKDTTGPNTKFDSIPAKEM